MTFKAEQTCSSLVHTVSEGPGELLPRDRATAIVADCGVQLEPGSRLQSHRSLIAV